MLSKYHASLLPKNVPEEKIYVSTNGLVPDDYRGLDNIKREPHRIIYASSYDRGLEKILSNWADIRTAVPDAEIHCYYGWNTYDSYANYGLIKDKGFKERMLNLFKQEGVFEHGRIGHKELLKEYSKSSIFAYPCTYTGEINCLALSKAIACGVFPLTNDFAVLPERNTYGKVVKDDKFIPALITLLRKGDTKINNEGYIEANSWESVARDWHENLFPNDTETLATDRFTWSYAQIDPKKTIVDIGSNKGHIFEGWDRSRITSVDIDDYELENFVRASAEDLPFEDKKFDQACLFEIVEHSKNPVKVLSEARRVAKKVIISVPYEFEWQSDIKPFNTLDKEMKLTGCKTVLEMVTPSNPAKEFYMEDGGKHLYHETYYTPELLRDHLTQAGFKEFRIIKLRFGKWAWLGAICESVA
jgi:ubiquinone/menaquinone biosynthesis C-methylase UbiE